MTLRRHWPLLASLLLTASGCADNQAEPSAEEQVSETTAELFHRRTSTANEETFTAFESGQVRPLALSPDGKLLFAVNTPDNRLEIFRVNGSGLSAVGTVMVGLEPVSVAARSDNEVWVVNHLSDSISIVDVSKPERAHVTRTLLIGDEPRDIVFAQGRAYVTAAHRGQNTGRDPQISTPGVGRADVWVFDPAALGTTLAGTPVTVLSLFADTPRALTVSPDGNTVYAAAFGSGNKTTALAERIVTNFGGLPPPNANVDGVRAPWSGLIVKNRIGTPDGLPHWLDELNRVWDAQVRFSLPDKDVFAIDASLPVPAEKAALAASGVGTVLFNMAVNPVSGKVYVSNLEAINEKRFEGFNHSGGTGSVRGHLSESRISVVNGTNVQARHLNKHINFAAEGTPAESAKSLAFPTGMQVSADGKTLYVAALGSSKLGVFSTAELEADTFVPSASKQIELSGGGPTGLVLDKKDKYAFVMTRFDNGISVVDLKKNKEIDHSKMYNPEPVSITKGRPFLYDARLTSAHGDSACASCHIFGDKDEITWDLGDPDGAVMNNPGPFTVPSPAPGFITDKLHPMKGPMSTQSLRGMANHGPMHWRGDRTGGNDVPSSAQPDLGTFNEDVAFKKFNVAFPGLLGRAGQLTDEQMQAFTNFILQVTYPPNPIRNLDNSLTAGQAAGRAFYFSTHEDGSEKITDTFHNCNGCHILNPAGNAEYGVSKPGFFGSDGRYSFDNVPEFLKVPHLRNAYTKVGMFGGAGTFMLPIDRPAPLPPMASALPPPLNNESFMGDQVRGFGFLHDGAVDTLFRFFGTTAFVQRGLTDPRPNPFGIPPTAAGIATRRQLEAFVMAFDTNLAPVVGQQVTLAADNTALAMPRIELLKQRAAAGETDLVVRARVKNNELGFLYVPETNTFATDNPRNPSISEADLLALAAKTQLTFTAVPPASGERIALDRDSDGKLDGADCDDQHDWDWTWDLNWTWDD
jgi:DNA-binding beta-propeller fold protein YncE